MSMLQILEVTAIFIARSLLFKTIPISSSQWNSTLFPVYVRFWTASNLAFKDDTSSFHQFLDCGLCHKEWSYSCSSVHRFRYRTDFWPKLLSGFSCNPGGKNIYIWWCITFFLYLNMGGHKILESLLILVKTLLCYHQISSLSKSRVWSEVNLFLLGILSSWNGPG